MHFIAIFIIAIITTIIAIIRIIIIVIIIITIAIIIACICIIIIIEYGPRCTRLSGAPFRMSRTIMPFN